MSDSGSGGSGVMQRLLAEHYRNEMQAKAPPVTQAAKSGKPSPPEPDQNRPSPFEDARPFKSPECGQARPDQPSTPRADSSLSARLDALCRSTLEKPANQQAGYNHVTTAVRNHSFGKEKAKSIAMTTPTDNGPISAPKKRSAAQEVLARFRMEIQQQNCGGRAQNDGNSPRPPPPSYHEAQLEAEQTKIPENSVSFVPGTPTVSPRYRLPESPEIKHGSGSRSFPTGSSGSSGPPGTGGQLNGHPKSSSGGDEYFYTDQVRRSNQKRGIRSKKNKNSIVRSSSLHQNQEDLRRAFEARRQPGDKSDLGNEAADNRSMGRPAPQKAPSQARHTSSRSAPMQSTSGEGSQPEARRCSVHGNVCDFPDAATSDFDHGKSTSFTKIGQTSEKQQTMPQTPTASQAPYMRAPYPSYYPGIPGHGIVGQSPQQVATTEVQSAPLMAALGGNSPQRPPPPPYPSAFNGVDPAMTQETGEGASYNLQRPKSLALGNLSKRKASNGGSSQNSPGVTSPTTGNCFGTPVRGTGFYSTAKDSPYGGQQGGQIYVSSSQMNGSPHQRQTSNGSSGAYPTRSVRSNGMTTPSSSSSSTATVVSTPSYPDLPPFGDASVRSPNLAYNMAPQNSHAPYHQESYNTAGSSSGVSKSDSLNSTTSSSGGASRIARRRKRNSSSYGNTSGSGSSSNGGSRPNSNADLTDRLEIENETLRNKLDVAMQKLRKYESLEKDLIRITQQHQALQQSAGKREALEEEMRNQLSSKLHKLEQERDSFEGKVIALTEQLQTMDLASAEPHDSSIIETYEARHRKSAEKERQLEEELEECRERISEQNVDLQLLTSSLQKAQTTVTVLKEKFLQNNQVDAYTKQLSEHLASLQKIVDERHEIETELKDRLKKQLAQRPLKSTSSNDEGISEMDSVDVSGGSSSNIDLYNSIEGQMLEAKAKWLKWQHCYLEQGLLKHVSSSSVGTEESRRIYSALRRHRHAMSDPGFDKISLKRSILPLLSGGEDGRVVKEEACCLATGDSPSRSRTDCACQTPDENWLLGDDDENASLCDKVLGGGDAPVAPGPGPGRGGQAPHAEGDSPSEGYHSQQSSGSPTPNTERSAVHFPVAGEPPIHVSHFRRNRSADVLTSLNV